MSRTFDEIRDLLAGAYAKERKRLRSYGTKIDPYQYANVTAEFVRALMCGSRYRELKRLEQYVEKEYEGDFKHSHLTKYIQERKRATKKMSAAIQNSAERKDKERPWKNIVKKEKKEKKHRRKHK